jgi:hypothetical protein
MAVLILSHWRGLKAVLIARCVGCASIKSLRKFPH